MANNTAPEELERQIGPRDPRTRINSKNRTLVRRWLTAQGVESKTARGLNLHQLASAYHDTSNSELADLVTGVEPATGPVAHHLQRHQQQQQQGALDMETPATSTSTSDPDQVQQIAQAIAGVMNQNQKPQGIDRNEVAAIVRELAPELIEEHSVRRVELIRPDGTKRIDGAHYALEKVTKAINAGVHIWMPGPAGSGKTTLARQTAEALDMDFYATGAVHSVYSLIGFKDATGTYQATPFRQAFEHGGLFLFDEVDGSNPAALTAINQAIDNGEYAFPDGMIKRNSEFRCIAAANTYGHGATSEYVGRIRQDGAVLDRFAFFPIGYDENVEKQLAGDYETWHATVSKARSKAHELGVGHIISPRATRDGAKLLEVGIDLETVREACIKKGLDQASWDRVREVL